MPVRLPVRGACPPSCLRRLVIGALTTLALLAPMTAPLAAEIKVMASVAIKDAYLELQPGFEKASGNKVVTDWVPTVEMMKRLKEGEKVDLVLMSSTNIDELTKLGRLTAGTKVDVVRSGIGVAVRKGAPHPDISSGEKLKATLLAAKSIAYSTGPSGVYLVGLFEKMGIADAIKAKTTQITGVPVGELVARGDAEIGFQQVPEILPVKGIDYLGPLPADVQSVTTFSTAIHTDAKAGEAAAAWVKYLTAPAATEVIRKHGLEQVTGK